MKKKNRMRLKGQLRMYMSWPLIMAVLLAAMDIWVFVIDKKAGFIMTIFILIYLGIAGGLYFYNRSLILRRAVFLQPVADPCGSDSVLGSV